VNAADVLAKLSAPMSFRRRIATVIALLGGLCAAGLIGLLWLTEPELPPRTQIAFGAFVVIGLAWAAYGSWALARRTPLFALDRVVAGWLALAATGFATVIAILVTVVRDKFEPGLYLIIVGVVVLALINLARARKHRATLLRRKRELGG